MTGTRSGIRLFESVGPEQLGSVNLVVSCLAHGPRELEPALRALLMTSGVSGSLVNPSACLQLAVDVGLVVEEGGKVTLSAAGVEVLHAATWPPYNLLNEAQGRHLLDALMRQRDFADPLARLLRKMTRQSDGSLNITPQTVSLPLDELQCLHALQSMLAVTFSDGILAMASAVYTAVIDVLGTSVVVSEDELTRVLELQRRRAIEAEYYVLDLEVDRLKTGSRHDLAGLVERIAARDVAAGYDIRSFELDGSDRFIEVKSSTGSNLRFVLSRNERQFLKENESTGWIYFVPRVHELPHPSCAVIAIPNPSEWIDERATIEAQDFLIEFPVCLPCEDTDNANVVLLPLIKDGSHSQSNEAVNH